MTRSAPGLALCAALVLAGCAVSHFTPAQDLESADTAASLAYAAVAEVCNAAEDVRPAVAPQAEALKSQAWSILKRERQAYKLGLPVAGFVAELIALKPLAKAL